MNRPDDCPARVFLWKVELLLESSEDRSQGGESFMAHRSIRRQDIVRTTTKMLWEVFENVQLTHPTAKIVSAEYLTQLMCTSHTETGQEYPV